MFCSIHHCWLLSNNLLIRSSVIVFSAFFSRACYLLVTVIWLCSGRYASVSGSTATQLNFLYCLHTFW
uniref:Uncharacterized protein n=1 Tax=Anguilla anguilla TaxID=7936 RepID=A0A0E9RWX8_ANGAN